MSILALRSNNIHDIQAAIQLGGWTNTKKSHKVKVGDTVLVFANKKSCKEAGIDWETQTVLVGILKEKPYKLDKEDTRWPSNTTGTDKEYLVRFDLLAMDLVPFSMFRDQVKVLDKSVGHLNGGKYFE